ncbi:MAG TPA: M20/M25/M40 family metallo-hydrolase, partial [Solirubrobacteraceae bacterium]|nr:M20/M25/M40 family metallo-hydrolase [Solirubrobacteraceae bacterium]
AAHAGATPMDARRDALAGAVEAAVELERLGRESPSGTTVATVGAISASPGAINVIPGEAELHVDIRDRDLSARDAVADAFVAELEAITERRGLELELETIARDTPVACSPAIVAAARSACRDLAVEYVELTSGAYHDAMLMSAKVPVGMIFVPSVDGVSHSPHEYTAPDDIDRGVRVLAGTLRALAHAP